MLTKKRLLIVAMALCLVTSSDFSRGLYYDGDEAALNRSSFPSPTNPDECV
jgi:hypothetical protein